MNLGERYIFDWRGIAVTDFEGSHCSTSNPFDRTKMIRTLDKNKSNVVCIGSSL